MTYQAGPEPSVCVIRAVPHLHSLERDGTLILGETGAGYLEIRNCKLLTPTLSEDRKWELPILDRRWKWQFGEINGVYNVKRPDKTYIRERTPQQLAEMCLEAMGERRGNWDIGRIPNFARPQIEWEHTNPASALDDLLQSLGCVWTLDYFADRVTAWPVGSGNDLPEWPTISRAFGLSSLAKPDSIACYGSRTLFQARFATEAVGRDTDGKYKPLSQLSYFAHLADNEPDDFSGIEDTFDDDGEEKLIGDLARETVYRTYRITGLANGGWSPEVLRGTTIEPASFFDLEFIDTRAEQEIDENDIGPDGVQTGRKVNKPAQITGRWIDPEGSVATPAAGNVVPYRGHFTIEPRLGLVRLSEPAWLYEGDNASRAHKAAEIYVDVAFYAGRNGLFAFPFVEQQTGERNGTGPRVIVRGEVEDRVIQKYEKTAIVKTIEQPGDTTSQLTHWVNAALEEYRDQPSMTRTYHGLRPIAPDGRIRQVTWSGGDGSGPRTQVSVGTEHNPYTPTPEENRRKRSVEELLRVPAWQRTNDERKLLTAQFG